MGLESLQDMLDQVKKLEAEIVRLEARRDELKTIVSDADLVANLPDIRREIALGRQEADLKMRQAEAALTRATAKEAEVDQILKARTAEGEALKANLIREGEQTKAADIAEGLRERKRLVAEGQEDKDRMLKNAVDEARKKYAEEAKRLQGAEAAIATLLRALDSIGAPRR